jgi:hypothetical protein
MYELSVLDVVGGADLDDELDLGWVRIGDAPTTGLGETPTYTCTDNCKGDGTR